MKLRTVFERVGILKKVPTVVTANASDTATKPGDCGLPMRQHDWVFQETGAMLEHWYCQRCGHGKIPKEQT